MLLLWGKTESWEDSLNPLCEIFPLNLQKKKPSQFQTWHISYNLLHQRRSEHALPVCLCVCPVPSLKLKGLLVLLGPNKNLLKPLKFDIGEWGTMHTLRWIEIVDCSFSSNIFLNMCLLTDAFHGLLIKKVRERLVWNISPARWSCLPYLNASISFFSCEGFCGSPVWDCSQRPRRSDKKRWVEIIWPQFLCFEDLERLANIRFFVWWLRNKQTTTTKKSYVSELLQIHTSIRTLKKYPFLPPTLQCWASPKSHARSSLFLLTERWQNQSWGENGWD